MPSQVIYKTVDLKAGEPQIIHTVTDGKQCSFTHKITNRNKGACEVQVAFARADQPTAAEWNEAGTELPAKGVLRESGIVMPEKIRIVGLSNADNVSFNLWGYEEVPQ